MKLGVEGKRAVVTGGSRGIGRGIVQALVRCGVSVAACYHRESDASQAVARELEAAANGSYMIQCDVADEASVNRMAADVRRRFAHIDILVNNAGVVSHKMLVDMDISEWRLVVDTNLTSMYLIVRSLLDCMPVGSSIINVSSAVAMVGLPARTAYTASKAGVIGLSRSMCKELGPKGIRVNTIAPGIIETDQVAGLSPAQRSRYEQFAALGRLGTPDDVAGAALFLASDLSRFISGVTLNVDGGI
jgi:3-oxoacyl-[acyl-carrier protein] reductase